MTKLIFSSFYEEGFLSDLRFVLENTNTYVPNIIADFEIVTQMFFDKPISLTQYLRPFWRSAYVERYRMNSQFYTMQIEGNKQILPHFYWTLFCTFHIVSILMMAVLVIFSNRNDDQMVVANVKSTKECSMKMW